MANVNKVILIGNLTRDPEVRYTPKGTAVTDIGLAVNRVSSSEGGERREETTFVDVTLWGRTAEIAAPGIWHRGDWPVQRNSPTRAGLGRARRIWRSAVLVEKMQTRFWVALWFLSGHTESVVRRLTPMLRPADRGRNQRSD